MNAGRPPTAVGQVRAVLQLRLSAIRGRDRWRAAVGLGTLLGVVASAPTIATMLPRDQVRTYGALAPTAWLLFAVAATIATATGTGGRQLLTRAQAAAFPMSPAADHLGAVLMAPLNLSWLLQAVGLLTLTAWQVGPAPALPSALLLTVLWIVAVTCAAQAVGWLVELLRTSQTGLVALRAAATGAVLVVTGAAITGRVGALQILPDGVVDRTLGLLPWRQPLAWSVRVAGLLVWTAGSWWAGVGLLRAVYRRPPLQQNRTESRRYPRRPTARTTLGAALRIDLAGVRRSAPLRRGLVAMAVIPAGVAVASGLPWSLLPLLPGLVGSAAGLLFGVNAFALDGPGALWRETLPGRAGEYLAARMVVLAGACLGGAGIAVLAGCLRASAAPTSAELVAVLAATVCAPGQVVSRCAVWSLRRPYAASLREARDQPAPPAAMAGYASRLALGTTLLGIVFVWLAGIGSVTATLLIAAGALLLSARRLVWVAREWEDPAVRCRVLTIVAEA